VKNLWDLNEGDYDYNEGAGGGERPPLAGVSLFWALALRSIDNVIAQTSADATIRVLIAETPPKTFVKCRFIWSPYSAHPECDRKRPKTPQLSTLTLAR
jgi:hypothetical protein